MKKWIGIVLMGIGGIGGCSVCTIWGLILSLIIVARLTGLLGLMIGFVLFPVALLVVPWYAGFALHDWFPLIMSYGGLFGGLIIFGIGYRITKEEL